jgi:hypothetical protein
MSSVDEICPSYYGEDRLSLSLVTTGKLQAFSPVLVSVDYSSASPEGVSLPLEMIVQGPSPQSYIRRVFSSAPTSIAFTPKEGGSHLVMLREYAHNRWWGRLVLDIDGPSLEQPTRK